MTKATGSRELVERLRATEIGEVLRDGVCREELVPVNPDGPEAADALDAKDRTIAGLQAEVERLRGLVFASLFHLRRDDAAFAYHNEAKKALKGQTP